MADYKIPSEPINGFKMPFADEGQKTIIPDAASSGRASMPLGFPVETQLPLSEGGIAPNRLDFQGILHMLSAFAFWQQSGGLYTYKKEYNYTPPALVVYSNSLWWCRAENGPSTAVKRAVEPGTNETYWTPFINQLLGVDSGGSGGIASLFGNPVGTVIMYGATSAPSGYLACNGNSFSATTYPKLYTVLGGNRTPDMRGLFVRGYDPTGVNDPSGTARKIGSLQGDAIRNITGTVGVVDYPSVSIIEGAFYNGGRGVNDTRHSGHGNNPISMMDVSRSVPTAAENRPKNINLLYCIKHD